MNWEQMISTLIDAHSDTINIIGKPLRDFVNTNGDVTFHLSTGDQTVPSIPKMQAQLQSQYSTDITELKSKFYYGNADNSRIYNPSAVDADVVNCFYDRYNNVLTDENALYSYTTYYPAGPYYDGSSDSSLKTALSQALVFEIPFEFNDMKMYHIDLWYQLIINDSDNPNCKRQYGSIKIFKDNFVGGASNTKVTGGYFINAFPSNPKQIRLFEVRKGNIVKYYYDPMFKQIASHNDFNSFFMHFRIQELSFNSFS